MAHHDPAFQKTTTYAEMRFSKWVESLRKDVECTFRILKGRFRILKTGIPLHGIEVCDQMWLTCCALHNFLLVEDGLDETWDASNYLTQEGGHDQTDINSFIGRAVDACQFESSGMGLGSDLRLQPNLCCLRKETMMKEMSKLWKERVMPQFVFVALDRKSSSNHCTTIQYLPYVHFDWCDFSWADGLSGPCLNTMRIM